MRNEGKGILKNFYVHLIENESPLHISTYKVLIILSLMKNFVYK